MNKRGTVSVLFAATVPIALVAGVFVVDAARIWLAQARLQSALDAAALTAARDIDSPDRDANTRAVLTANYNGGAPPTPGQANNGWENVKIQPSADGNRVTVTGSVDVRPLVSRILGLNGALPGTETRTIVRSADAARTTTGLEVALVFDTTLSMAEKSSVTGLMHIESARNAALQMLATLYGDRPNTPRKEWMENLYFSIVPFNIAVNIGTSNVQLLDPRVSTPKYSGGFSWSGCVEVRQGAYHVTDDGPMVSGLLRYYWPSTYNPALNDSNGSCTATQSYMGPSGNPGANRVCMGHNDWTAPSDRQGQNNFIVDATKYVQDSLGINKTLSFGPNAMCPTMPILPLTMDRKTVEARLALLPDLPFAFGTMVPTGLQGAWYTLSPQWRKGTTTGGAGWTSMEPTVSDGRPAVPALPLDYNAENMRKIVVLLSDGDNNWPNARNITQAAYSNAARLGYTSGNTSRIVAPENTRTELFYTGYGYLSTESRLGINVPPVRSLNSSQLDSDYSTVRNSSSGADARLDWATAQLCTNMKKGGQITIYVVGFGVASTAHRTLLQNCATSADTYLEAATPEELASKFSAIAQQLATLRITK